MVQVAVGHLTELSGTTVPRALDPTSQPATAPGCGSPKAEIFGLGPGRTRSYFSIRKVVKPSFRSWRIIWFCFQAHQ